MPDPANPDPTPTPAADPKDPKDPKATDPTPAPGAGGGEDGKLVIDPKSGEWVPAAKLSELNRELKKYKDAEAKAAEAKLLEDKKYEELIANKDKELGSYKSKYEDSIKFASFAEEAVKAGVVNARDAYKLADLSDIEIDDNGGINGMAEKIAKLKEEKPYLFNGASGAVGGPSNPGGTGGGNNGGNNNPGNKPTYKESETKDPKFFKEHSVDIGLAYLEGRVLKGQ